MTLTQVQYVVAIADTKSMNKAANKLFVSQPALSEAIKDLEAELQTQLFIRTNKGVIVTTEGEEFLSYARQMVELGKLVEERFVNQSISK
ncbi:MAG: LysR family transcriptional regulator [Cellulosilyticum sp.]|nr:LysR family transcriptional regulator [Cellulosilyticum sp.]